MNSKSVIMWLVAIAALLFGAWLCRGVTMPPLPPVPKKPKAPLLSPKDAASKAKLLVVVAPPAPFLHTNVLVWEQPGEFSTVNVIERQDVLTSKWIEIGRTTNVHRFTIYSTNVSGFYRVGSVFK